MQQPNLTKDSIAQPELWRLVIMLDRKSLHCALYPPVAREQLIWRSFPLDSSAPSRLKAIEDIIYDNPLLLCDFRKVDCILADSETLLVPSDALSEDYEMLFNAAHPAIDCNHTDINATSIADNATLLSVPDNDINAFLSRTFYNIKFHQVTDILTRYFFKHTERLTEKRAIILISEGKLMMMLLKGKNLVAANTFTYSRNSDAAYYILASLQQAGIDPTASETSVLLWGEPLTANDSISLILRPYIANFKPVPFPTLRHRVSKSTLEAPFPLLIMPLCE